MRRRDWLLVEGLLALAAALFTLAWWLDRIEKGPW